MAVYYADFGSALDGDGTTHAQALTPGGAGAWNTLAGKALATGDTVWIRRSGTALALAASISVNAQALLVGWPKSGDVYYATRPSGAQGSWDGDGSDYAEISTAVSGVTPLLLGASAGSPECHRLSIKQQATNTASARAVDVSSANALFYNCHIEYAQGQTNALYAAAALRIQSGGNGRFYNCTATLSGAVTSTNAATAVVDLVGSAYFEGCSITATATGNTRRLVLLSSTDTSITAVGCSFSHSGTSIAVAPFYFSGAGANATFINSDFSHDTTTNSLSWFQYAAANNRHTMNGYRVRMNKGVRWTMPPQFNVHFERFNQTSASSTFALETRALGVDCGGVVAGTNFSFQSNTSGDVQLRPGVLCLVDNVTTATFTPFGSPGVFPGFCCKDYGGSVGAWRYIGPYSDVSKASPYRDGGEEFSVKAQTTSAPTNAVLAPLPGLDTIWVELASGAARTITLYVAHKGFATAPTKGNLWLETEYLDQASGAHKGYASGRDAAYAAAALASDASTWVGDTGLTVCKLTLTVTPQQTCVVPVRVFMSAISGGSAYVLIDPKAVVS